MNERELLGKVVLVDFSYFDEFENSLGYLQFHGKIIAADEKMGIVVHDMTLKETKTMFYRLDLTPSSQHRLARIGNPQGVSWLRTLTLCPNGISKRSQEKTTVGNGIRTESICQ